MVLKTHARMIDFVSDKIFWDSSYTSLAACFAAMVTAGGGRIVLTQSHTLTTNITAANVSWALFNSGDAIAPITVDNATGGIAWSSTRTAYPNHYVYIDGVKFICDAATGYLLSLTWPNGGGLSPAEPHCIVNNYHARPTAYDGSVNRPTSGLLIKNAQNVRIINPSSQFNSSTDTSHIHLDYGADANAFCVQIAKPNLQSGAYGVKATGWLENLQIEGGELVNDKANILADATLSNIAGDKNPILSIRGGHYNSASRNIDATSWASVMVSDTEMYVAHQTYSQSESSANIYLNACNRVQISKNIAQTLSYNVAGPTISTAAVVSLQACKEIDVSDNDLTLYAVSDVSARLMFGVVVNNSDGSKASGAVSDNAMRWHASSVATTQPPSAILVQGNGSARTDITVAGNAYHGSWTRGAHLVDVVNGQVHGNENFGAAVTVFRQTACLNIVQADNVDWLLGPPQLDGPPFAQNMCWNGEFAIWQRGTSLASHGDDAYGPDGWNNLSDGAGIVSLAKETSTVPTGSASALRITVATANKKFAQVFPVESLDCAGLLGSSIAISFQARKGGSNATLGKLRSAIISWAGTADAITSDVVSAWGAEGTNPTLATSWAYETTPTDHTLTTSYQRFGAAGIVDTASAKQFALFIWSDDADATVADIAYIGQVQIEGGDTITPYASMPYGESFEKARRYYRVLGRELKGAWLGAASCMLQADLHPAMRSAPTLSLADSSPDIEEFIAGATRTGSGSAIATSEIDASAFWLTLDGFSSATAQNPAAGSQDAILTASAEL
jgi:hypothetical protein